MTTPDKPAIERTLSDIIPPDGTEGLMLDMAAAANGEQPKFVHDYAERKRLGKLSVDPLTTLELVTAKTMNDITAERRATH